MFLLLKKSLQKVCLCFFLVVVCYVICVHMYSISEGVVKVLAA